MVPFLYSELLSIIRGLMERVIKPGVLSDTSEVRLLKIDLEDSSVLIEHTKVDIGFSAEKALKETVKENKLSERQVMEFKVQCRSFVLKVLKKLLEKCPATYSLVQHLACLDPRKMSESKTRCKEKLKKVLTYLVAHKRINERDCDECIKEYCDCIDNFPSFGSAKFTEFNPNKDRLDEFYSTFMSWTAYSKVFDVVKMLLTLSHGQASVERGFSVNKEVEVENLKEYSLVSQRLVCDYVNSVGGILNVPITKELMTSASQSRNRYEVYLAKERDKKKTDTQKRKREELSQEIEELKRQCKQAKLDIDSLTKSADSYSMKAEKESNLSFIAHSNSLRQKAKDKMSFSDKISKKLDEKVQQLKEC
ncbi:uncharacterized protein LOC128237234 [Mya arenaria]|uniref:uncharacterized protein LOC128237234 n=1 Tax=Mya arenaria TaxID=6604 RepID=UPI0022DFBF64|nr:uncharacterized protein LOC128237234 [Mya arenaria]